VRRLPFARETRGEAEPGQPHLAGRLVEQDVRWLDIFVNEPALVKSAESGGNSDGEAQKASHLHGRADQPVDRLTPLVFEHQRRPTGFAYEVQRAHRPRPVEFVL